MKRITLSLLMFIFGSLGYASEGLAFMQSGDQLICSSPDSCHYTIQLLDLGDYAATVYITCPQFRGIHYPTDRVVFHQNYDEVRISLISHNHQTVEMDIVVNGTSLTGNVVDQKNDKSLKCHFPIRQ